LEGWDHEVSPKAADRLRFPEEFLELTRRLTAFTLWLWVSPKDRGKGFRHASTVSKLLEGLGMAIKRSLHCHVLEAHSAFRTRLTGMAKLEKAWGVSVTRQYALRGEDLRRALPSVRHLDLAVLEQARLGLKTALAFCLRVGEVSKGEAEEHWLKKRELSVVRTRDGRVCGVELTISTSKGVWASMARGRSLVLHDPSRLGRCGLCSRWFLQGCAEGRTRCVLHALAGQAPEGDLIGLDPHCAVIPDLLNYMAESPALFPDEPLFPRLTYGIVAGVLHQVADFLGVPHNLLCSHCLRRGGTCDKARALDAAGRLLYQSVQLRVFGRWSSSIWEVVYAEMVYGVLVLA
jgi:hypothetical protein